MRDMTPKPGTLNRRLCGGAVLVACLVLLALPVLLPSARAEADCGDVDISPVADFTYAAVPAEKPPIAVNFFSTSEGGMTEEGGLADPIESYSWKFGDSSSSKQSSPLHTYAASSARYQAAPEPFSVTLTIKTECGRSSTTTKNVSVFCLDQKAGFTITRPEGEGPYAAPVVLYLKDTTLHAADAVTTYRYTLWDAGMTRLFKESTEKDPTFIIRNGGSYLIRQEVYKGCSNPLTADTEMKKSIEVTGSASSDAIPMETIPFTTTTTVTSATATQAVTTAPSVSASRTAVPVQETTTAPGTGTLVVNTTPSGALVFVNGAPLGSSPVTIPGLGAGRYNLRLEKAGYRNMTVLVEIGDGRVTEYSAVLETDAGGMGILPIVVAVLIIAAGAGAVYRYKKKKRPVKVDWNDL